MLFYAFYAVFGLIALWLVIGGPMSFRTRKITLYVGDKPFACEGTKAIVAGVFTTMFGMLAFAYAVHAVYAHYTGVQ